MSAHPVPPAGRHPPIVFIDGTCVLCSGFADFILRRDRRGVVRVASLQGETAAAVLPPDARGDGEAGPRSIVLWSDGRVIQKSEAVLTVLTMLGARNWVGGVAATGRWVPRAWRDRLYDMVARHRLRWFGRRAECRVPAPHEAGRFLP